MLATIDTPGLTWGCTCNNNFETTTSTEIYYGKNVNGILKPGTEDGAIRPFTLLDVNNTLTPMRHTRWFPRTVDMVLELDNFIDLKKLQFDKYSIKDAEKVHAYYNVQESSRETGREGDDKTNIMESSTRGKNCQHRYRIKLIISEPCVSKKYFIDINRLQLESKGLLTYLQIAHPTTELLFKTAERNLSQDLVTRPNMFKTYSVDNSVAYLFKPDNIIPIKNTYAKFSSLRMEYSECTKNKFSRKSYTWNRQLLATSYQEIDEQGRQIDKQSPFSNLKGFMGPYAQIQVVYNVMEQTGAEMKEKATSQQFKQRSQGIGSGSVSGGDSSSGSSKRRTIKIESGVSFSVEFIDKGKSTDSHASSSVPEPELAEKKKPKEKKKSLHRCLCTTSFPTDDKKLKNKPCDLGVCVPGECSPSECFKRLQQKYGSKKKSDSDVSSSQASQTSKKKVKEDKKILKEKGSSSISKYKESVEEKVLPPKEEEKFNIATCMEKCCKQLQFWKKDKHIDLKPAIIGTDISVKDGDKSFGSHAETQSDKKGIKKKDKKAAKMDKKADEEPKKEEKKDVKTEGKKEGKKDDKKEGKKEDKKEGKKEGKKEVKTEVQTETKSTEKKMKKIRPLKPYECEPGVCTPKVCSPKECYERKYPPPPPPPEKSSSLTKFKNCLKKMCCKRPVEEKGSAPHAATQSPKALEKAKAPGATVYQEKGTSGPKGGKIKGQKGGTPGVTTTVDASTTAKSKKGGKQKTDTGAQLPVESGDVPIDRQSKKHTAGIQYFTSIDRERMMKRQGVNIGSECECSVEFYKMLY